jgi:hypothetical protein
MNTVVKTLLPRTWRTETMHQKYEEERQTDVRSNECPLCAAPALETFSHWKIVENRYPYDAVAQVHHMLVTHRHISSDTELTAEEYTEYLSLKKATLNEAYTFVLEALPRNKSIPGHHHLHLIVPKIIAETPLQ